jgi:hypothetical protein
MQIAGCRQAMNLWLCRWVEPDKSNRSQCYDQIDEGYTHEVRSCQQQFEEAINTCVAKYPGAVSPVDACLSIARRLQEMAWARCDYILDKDERKACYASAQQEFRERERKCLELDRFEQ